MTAGLRRRDAPGTTGRPTPPTGRWTTASLVAAIALGGWGVVALQGQQHEPVGVGESVAIDGGQLRLDEVLPDVMSSHQVMPGGMMPDPVPPGMRRYHLHISLHATASDGLTYDAEDLYVDGAAMEATAAHTSQLGDGQAPQGSTVAGRLTFDVPAEASDLVLHHRDARTPIAFDAVADDGAEVHGH